MRKLSGKEKKERTRKGKEVNKEERGKRKGGDLEEEVEEEE